MKLSTMLLVLPLCLGCVSGDTGPRLEHTAGAIVTGDLDTVWRAVTATFKEIDGLAADIDDARYTASVPYMGAIVRMRAERKDGGNTILRVQALRDGREARSIADKVMTAVQRKLF